MIQRFPHATSVISYGSFYWILDFKLNACELLYCFREWGLVLRLTGFYCKQTCKNSSRSVNPMYMDPNNPHWGWSWLERWMAARPWESRTATEKQLNDTNSMKSASHSIGGEITRAYARRDLNMERPSPVSQKPSRPGSRQSPSTPPSKASSVVGKSKMASPRGGWGLEDDSRSMMSLQSERPRRHSIAGSSVRDDESLASSPAVPSYMVPTESARAKARQQSPLGEKHETPERVSAGSAKKRLSFQASPAGPRRHSGPPKVDITSIKEIDVNAGHNTVINGGSK
eukprot:TRINITY_DN1824_c0_g1_i4.p1 TRINITY_DN1824_c0_g1~~TRINITY_DN1824_c0_g1_i4.p1  ORF type:complete len:285 (-),score=55.23 TRINITY_DN1824_c0_g1_i4:278-1132(-)